MTTGDLSPQTQLNRLRDQLVKLEALRGLLGDELTDQKKAQLESQIQTLVQTGGGAIIASDVTLTGGDLVGRDKWQVFLGDQYVGVSPEQVPPEALRRAYLRALAHECHRLPLGVVDPRFLQTGPTTPVTLSDVYVDLDVTAPVREAREPLAGLPRFSSGEGGERTPLLEAVAHPQATRLVLLGDPGSGKTTFVNYLTYALALAEETNSPSPLLSDDAAWRNLLPVRLILREVAARCLPPEATRGEARMLWDALRADLVARLGGEAADRLFPYLQRWLLEQGGLVLLDGLDEVPEADRRRGCLLEAVADLVAQLPSGQARVLVTARPYACADPRWSLEGFQTLTLAPFSQEQVARFVARWYRALGPVMGWDEATAQERGERLREALVAGSYLADLATRPLLLTLMATLHTSWGRLPEDRADLYEETVRLLLSRWQRAREVKDAAGETVTEPAIAQVLQVDENRVREALHRLAYQVHGRQGAQAGRADAPADVAEGEVLAAFARLLPADVNPTQLLRYLETRAGLLVARAPGVYAFPHRSFQEYLAACHLADGTDFATALRERVWADPAWWREVFLLSVGKARQGGLGNAMHVVNTLLPQGPEDVAQRTDTHWQAATLAAQALLDLRFPEATAGQIPLGATLRRARRWLVTLLETPDALAPRERAAAGDLLGRLGDPRPGVSVISPPPSAREGPGVEAALPDVLWVEVPAGPFLMGSAADDELAYDHERPQHSLSLPGFLVSRYPITNAQYRPFIEDGGYDQPRYWTPEGWAWRNGEWESDLSIIQDDEVRKNWADWLAQRPAARRNCSYWWDHPRWGLVNRPVVGVTWFEAMAYCRWLTEREASREESGERRAWRDGRSLPFAIGASRYVVRLPTEAEWEKAARGPDGKRWPWGDTWAEGRANTEETNVRETSAVGVFPAGASPYGALDVAGNVWEWTHSRWGRTSTSRPDYGYPYDSADGREDPGGPDWRVVRGGSWVDGQRDARCAFRLRFYPDDWLDDLGFRVVVSLALSPP